MFPKCYYKNDRMDRGIISLCLWKHQNITNNVIYYTAIAFHFLNQNSSHLNFARALKRDKTSKVSFILGLRRVENVSEKM